MIETAEYFNMLNRVTNAIKTLPRRAASLAVTFSKQRFRDQAWVDNNTDTWKKRAPGRTKESRKRQGRAVLVDSGRLRRSIRVVSVTDYRAVIGSDAPYARAHNDGFRGRVSQSVRSHTRMSRKKRPVRVSAHSRTITKNLPRRRFIGASAVLDKQIERMMTAEISHAILNT